MKRLPLTALTVLLILFCRSNPVSLSGNIQKPESEKKTFSLYLMPVSVEGSSPELIRYAGAIEKITHSYLLQAPDIHLLTSHENMPGTGRSEHSGANFALNIFIGRSGNRYNCRLDLKDLQTGTVKSAKLTPAPASSLGNLPADIFFEVQSLRSEFANVQGTKEILAITGQSAVYRRFKPSINPFRYYAYGIYYQDKNKQESIRYFNKALELEPYFIEAETARFETMNSGAPWINANYIRANRSSFQLFRYNRLDPVQTGLFFQKMGIQALKYNRSAAVLWLQRSNQLLLLGNRRNSVQYALNESLLGMVHLYFEKYSLADLKLKSAERILNDHSLVFTQTGLQLSLNLYALNRLRKNPKAAEKYKEILESQISYLNPAVEVMTVIQYNLGVTDYIDGRYNDAITYFKDIHKELSDAGLTNSRLAINNLLNMNASQIHLSDIHGSIETANRIAVLAKNTGLLTYPAYKYSVYNHSYALNRLGRNRDAARLRLSAGFSAYAPNRPLYESYVSIFEIPERSRIFYTMAEQMQVASYTGAFRIENHSQRVRARTYPGRQDDTNMLLRDILNERKNYPALNRLRENWLNGESDIEGKGILFVDIGPGLANLRWPAITTQSIARDFRNMTVIAWDLPQQVRLYQNTVASFKQREIRNKENMYIVGADGKEPFSRVFSEKDRWLLHGRNPVSYASGQPVIVRIANSIDIYFPYPEIERILAQMAEDMKDNPLLICFNRSILLKKAGETKYSVIGYVSVRGFHHNREILNRYGEPPYTLVESGPAK